MSGGEAPHIHYVAFDGCEWLDLCSIYFIPGKTAPGISWTECWLAPEIYWMYIELSTIIQVYELKMGITMMKLLPDAMKTNFKLFLVCLKVLCL